MRCYFYFFFSSRRRHTRFDCDWSSDVCSSDLAVPHDACQGGFHLRERGIGAAAQRGGEQAGQELVQVHLLGGDLVLHQIPDHGEQHCDERDDGEQQIERQGAGEKGNVVLEGRLQGAAHDSGPRPVPAALGLHATGSSSSSTPPRRATRRRRLASRSPRVSAARAGGASSSVSSEPTSSPSSSIFSAASSRTRRASLVRDAAPASGANRNPSDAPITTPNRNGPNPVLCSLTRPPPGRRGPPPRPGAAARATAAAAARTDR